LVEAGTSALSLWLTRSIRLGTGVPLAHATEAGVVRAQAGLAIRRSRDSKFPPYAFAKPPTPTPKPPTVTVTVTVTPTGAERR